MLALQQTFPVQSVWQLLIPPSPTKAPRAGRAKCHSKWGMEKGHAVMAHAKKATW